MARIIKLKKLPPRRRVPGQQPPPHEFQKDIVDCPSETDEFDKTLRDLRDGIRSSTIDELAFRQPEGARIIEPPKLAPGKRVPGRQLPAHEFPTDTVNDPIEVEKFDKMIRDIRDGVLRPARDGSTHRRHQRRIHPL